MLLSYLSLLSILSVTSTAKSLPHLDTPDQAKLIPAHEVILPCARCAFEDLNCEREDPDSYLTITFSTENNTLLANDHVIFPSPLPMEFSAPRHAGSGQDDGVRVSYALDARPIPKTPHAKLGDIYLLKLKLLDEFGRLASDYEVLVGLVRPESESGSDLAITEINTSALPHHHHHHHHPSPNDSNGDTKSLILGTLHALKTTAKECIHLLTHPEPPHHHHHHHPSTKNENENENENDSTPSPPQKDAHRTVPPVPKHGHRSHPYWHGSHRNFGRLVRPVILPALLGAATGVMAHVVM
ncbi:hypothetical protein P170DRAFT_508262 [Aspergillus steynii IBT 23096]|uniref:Uncharacterized protein n=1 Tax=Aspergillus steynii IBT 23096 TaxID=1392250 RepID=A0A2I2GAV9_9EURO|nr:uncharacterized protein P170DRAFT_508262 [Aspergillus steynii IBT 23096]PLB50000.1 hypothetical protein P170DRAFT_508262 [Aspergillus steynii IBT 23096]